MAKNLWVAAACLAASAAAQDARIPYVTAPVRLDGRIDPDEWGQTPRYDLDRRDQVWDEHTRGAWGGVADLSAHIHLAYDAAHLYVAGEVRDNSFVPQVSANRWEAGDAVEIFLNLDLSDDLPSTDGAAAPPTFNADDIQIFFMPFHEHRPWGQVSWDRRGAQRAALTGSTLTGLEVAFQKVAVDRYSFEAKLPFHALFGVDRPAPSRIGFGLALDDHDEGSTRYQYMTLNGRNPVDDTRNLWVIEFTGSPPLADPPNAEPALWNRVRPWLSLLALPAGAAMVLWLLLRAWSSIAERQPRLRHIGRWLAALAFALGLAMPRIALDLRESQRRQQLHAVVGAVHDGIQEMEKGTLGSYAGAQREQQLLELLRGKAISRRRYLDYVELTDLAEGSFGYGPRRYPGEFFDVRPYFIPLRVGQPERIDFRAALPVPQLVVVVSTPQPVLDFSEPVTPRLRVTVEREQAAEKPSYELSFDGPPVSASAFDRDRRDLRFELVDVNATIASVTLAALQGEDCQLVGLTAIGDERTRATPLDLGQSALTGIPVTLRGPWPDDSGIVLRGGERRVTVAPTEEGFDRAWLIYRATHPGVLADDLLTNALVGEVAVHFRSENTPPRVVVLQHQRNVLFERSRNNQVQKPLPGSNAEIAYAFTDDAGERHVDLVTEIELPRDKSVEAVTFRVSGHYAIRFRAVVFGREREAAPSDSASSPLTRAEQGGVRLRDEFVRRIDGATFAVYRDGRLIDATGTGVAPDVVPAGGGAAGAMRTDDGQRRVYESFAPLSGSGWRANVLGVFVRDDGFGGFSRMVHALGLGLCLLAFPVLLLMLAEAIAAFSSLRVRLVTALSVASLAPLAVLAWLVLRVVEEGHERQQRQHLAGSLDALDEQLDTIQRDLALSAEAWLRSLSDEAGLRLAQKTAHDELRALLQQRMASQRPPDWKGGFLRLELTPAPNVGDVLPLSLFDGDPALRGLETPLRAEPSVFVAWGLPVLGVRRVLETELGTLSLSAARPIDGAFLSRLVPQGNAVLCDVSGYPLATMVSGAGSDEWLRRMSYRAGIMTARREALGRSQTTGQAVFAQHEVENEPWIAAYRVFRDVDETPRALLGVLDVARPASLALPVGRVPVRVFLVAVAAMLVLFAVSLSSVVTSRISKPIERLARRAQALGMGDLDVRVEPSQHDGHIARLAQAFNGMAHDLRSRIGDLRALNLAMQELSSKLDLREAVATTVQLFMLHSLADRVRVLLPRHDSDRLVVYGDETAAPLGDDTLNRDLEQAVGPFSGRTPAALEVRASESGDRAPVPVRCGSRVVFPLLIGGRVRGCVLLQFEAVVPPTVNLELLTALATQVALAIENARLFMAAVEDPYTGAYVPDFFRQRLTRDVATAQARGQSLRLLGIALVEGQRLQAALGPERVARCLETLASGLRGVLPARATVGQWTPWELRVLVQEEGDAGDAAARVRELLDGMELGLPPEWSKPRLAIASAAFPAEAASAEFLLEVLDERLGASRADVAAEPTERPIEHLGPLVASSATMQRVLRALQRVAPTDIPVLIEGETGTGKELLADLAHAWSRRRRGPLVKVHCAALPESLLQSELFGHERGAFTGAEARKPGKFELARGGTVFLDEIGEVSLDVQVKLLRVLQEREIDRVGGVAPVRVDVRILAATNRNLREMVARGQFREDLYYRLQGMTLSVPPLRERRSEIPALVESFCNEARAQANSQVLGFTTDALDVLYRHDWPGNVRELRNAVVRAVVLATGEWIEPSHLVGLLPSGKGPSDAPEQPPSPRGGDLGPAGAAASGSPAAPGASASAAAPLASATEPQAQASRVPGPPEPSGPVPPALPAVAATRDRLQRLLRLLEERGELSVEDHVRASGVSGRTALRDFDTLIRQGRVARLGIRRGARYRLANGG